MDLNAQRLEVDHPEGIPLFPEVQSFIVDGFLKVPLSATSVTQFNVGEVAVVILVALQEILLSSVQPLNI